MKKTQFILAFIGLVLAGYGGYIDAKTDNEPQQKTQEKVSNLPPTHPPLDSSKSSQPTQQSNTNKTGSGIVKETFNGGGYTYASVKVGDKIIWLAGPEVKLDQGSQISWKNAAKMENFTSRSLNRVFEKIYFVGSFIQTKEHQDTSKGQVEEKILAARYVYLKVKSDDKLVWLAAPEAGATVNVGDTIGWNGGVTMKDFKSNSLDRMFEEVIFIDRVNKR